MRKDRLVLGIVLILAVVGLAGTALAQPDDPYTNGRCNSCDNESDPPETTPPDETTPAETTPPETTEPTIIPTTDPGLPGEKVDDNTVAGRRIDNALPKERQPTETQPQFLGALPFTGASILAFLVIAGGAIAAGVILVRRRSARREPI